ncbi:MAG TPA: hypothetical protein VJR89_02430, partial [Polyangiales bacterium]|nr:hypothetical protein [Polyangiales bacterium]
MIPTGFAALERALIRGMTVQSTATLLVASSVVLLVACGDESPAMMNSGNAQNAGSEAAAGGAPADNGGTEAGSGGRAATTAGAGAGGRAGTPAAGSGGNGGVTATPAAGAGA